tara:strand:+ start:1311 stop:2033 length:723 start_codon:yes stop_codon:yes gene_type:complete
MVRYFKKIKFIRYLFFISILGLLAISYFFFDFKDIFLSILNNKGQNISIFYSVIAIFFLRVISIIFPILPGTYCSVISGYLFGIKYGFCLIFIADFLACFSSFSLSRSFGRVFVKKLLGDKQMVRVELISKKYLEQNFFLMTGFLMTQFFDFVCYAIGLTKISWKNFMPALLISIAISDLPFVSFGYAMSNLQTSSISQILNGNVKLLDGPYLVILIISVAMVFFLGGINFFLQKRASKI